MLESRGSAGREAKVPQETLPPVYPHKVSGKGIDLDGFERSMKWRLHLIWVRHPWLVSIVVLLVVGGLVGLAIVRVAEPSVLRIAVGPAGSPDVQFVETLAAKFRTDRAGFRLVPVVQNEPVGLKDIHGRPAFDLAVARGNMRLSQDWPVVAILRHNVVALIVPAAGAHSPIKDARGRPQKRAK